MKKIVAFLFLLTVAYHGFAQDYRTHKVASGDTVYNLAKKYGVTEEAIYKLNPGSENSIQLGQVLVIPPKEIGETGIRKPLRFKKYVVQQKETVFGISQQNGIDMVALKEYNPYLYKEELGMGDTIQIPVYTKGEPQPIDYNQSIKNSSFGNLKHVVLPKETKYGIARKYNIEIERLKALNPNMGVIQPGQVLVVSRRENVPAKEAINEELYKYYVVQPYDEGSPETVYSLTRKFGISKDSLFALNPQLKTEGLEAGMKLIVPKGGEAAAYTALSSEIVDLEERIQRKGTKELVVLLPFKLEDFKTDSLALKRSQLKESRISRISLDFYSGVLMAMETAKNKGISVNLRTYDTQQSKKQLEKILQNNNFENVQAVIGPLLGGMVEFTAQRLERKNIPVFSPLTKMEMTPRDNLIQTRPTDERMENAMIAYLKKNHTDENIVIITDPENKDVKNRLQAQFPQAKVFVTTMSAENNYLKKSEIAHYLDGQKKNWVILESEKLLLLNMATSHLNLLCSDYKIKLFTTDRNSAYEGDEVSNSNLSNLRFTFPSFTRAFAGEKNKDFIKSYSVKYGIKPSQFAVRGYDLTYDILLRLAAPFKIYKSLSAPWGTEYVENKFQYEKKENGGYVNKAVYILEYGENLTLKSVEK